MREIVASPLTIPGMASSLAIAAWFAAALSLSPGEAHAAAASCGVVLCFVLLPGEDKQRKRTRNRNKRQTPRGEIYLGVAPSPFIWASGGVFCVFHSVLGVGGWWGQGLSESLGIPRNRVFQGPIPTTSSPLPPKSGHCLPAWR